jgi:hypothetical protein
VKKRKHNNERKKERQTNYSRLRQHKNKKIKKGNLTKREIFTNNIIFYLSFLLCTEEQRRRMKE